MSDLDINVLIGGAAGQGMDTLAGILSKSLHRQGFFVFVTKDYMSRVRGGHNFTQIRFGNRRFLSHRKKLDYIIALDSKTVELHLNELHLNELHLNELQSNKTEENYSENDFNTGVLICDQEIEAPNSTNIFKLPLKEIAKRAGNPKTE
ncbi:MAG: 2-oxoacid:acceptor oxidoreductase family protein, partial [Clostridiales bacterium]|nr:2-oxoacid:acceptor oxidoreductase family protein [Clostridiales bacterium]